MVERCKISRPVRRGADPATLWSKIREEVVVVDASFLENNWTNRLEDMICKIGESKSKG